MRTPTRASEPVERLLRLWTDPLPAGDGAGGFREVDADPCLVNGAPLSAVDLVARARAVQACATCTSSTS